jgi:hypothetical protein
MSIYVLASGGLTRLTRSFVPFLALLRHYKEALEELEQSEIRTLLLRMPMLDINEVGSHPTQLLFLLSNTANNSGDSPSTEYPK